MAKKPIEITEAHEARRLGERLIANHYRHLEGVPIRYLATSQERSKGGKAILATTQKLNPLNRYLITGGSVEVVAEEWLILFSYGDWYLLSESQREALVDHELAHIVENDDGNGLTLRGHDVEEFSEIIARHGLWKPDLRQFGTIAGAQLSLDDLARDAMADTADGIHTEVALSGTRR